MATQTSLAYQQLHNLLKELADVEYMLAHGPKRIAAAEKKVAAAEAACAEQKDAIQQLKKKADVASLDLKSREADIARNAGRLNDAGSNKEYEIITGQMETQRKACEQLEDQVLSMLGEVDEAAEELTTRESVLYEATKKSTEVAQDVAAKEAGLKEDVARLEAEIAESDKVLPAGENRATYLRLRQAQGAGAMSKVEDGYCEECNTTVTPQDTIRLNMGEFLLCRACGRFLYVGE